MNLTEQEIENLLRHAPQPAPPAGLKAELLADARTASAKARSKSAPHGSATKSWLRRWWPVLLPSTASLVCTVVLAFQQLEIRHLRESVRAASAKLVVAGELINARQNQSASGANISSVSTADDQAEIERLKARVAQLGNEIMALEQAKTSNAALRAQSPVLTLSQEELDGLAAARARALSIACVNNLKQFGLAVRVWAQDNDDTSPPDSLSMSNELGSAKMLVCPADTNRVVAANWAAFTPANCSYEYLATSVPNVSSEPTRVLARCPLHGNIGLCDGSVQMGVTTRHPEWLKERDGKLYFEPK